SHSEYHSSRSENAFSRNQIIYSYARLLDSENCGNSVRTLTLIYRWPRYVHRRISQSQEGFNRGREQEHRDKW
ncbi:hypothetical protein PFISCL1PPCAC_5096, partial [Pristionchus fissidentatus]